MGMRAPQRPKFQPARFLLFGSIPKRWNVPIIVLVTLAVFGPFLPKAFHIDDPLFIWCAQQIVAHPLDPYGFSVNWFGTLQPMAEIMRNPPLSCYYLASAGALLGWSEVALHGAFLLPVVACSLGAYALARQFCATPLLAALLTLACPAFLLSGTTVMCDILMVAFWIWAVFAWVRGTRSGRARQLALAATLITAAIMTKFNGLILIPVLFLYSAIRGRGMGLWALYLAAPIVVLVLYLAWGASRYGGSLLGGLGFAVGAPGGPSILSKTVTLLVFAGGCAVPLVLGSVAIWTRRAALLWLLGSLLLLGILFGFGLANLAAFRSAAYSRPASLAQLIVLLIAGVTLIRMLWTEWRQRPSPEAALLTSWVAITLGFAFVAWSVSGRYLLPMLPAVAILIVRHLEQTPAVSRARRARLPLLVLLPSAAVAVGAAIADAKLAHSARGTATTLCRKYGGGETRLWYEGHWGFQYYMERCGGRALDAGGTSVRPGDWIVIPENNTNLFPINPEIVRQAELLEVPIRAPIATMSRPLGAGFYAAVWGSLPFAVGTPPPERYQVLRVAPTR